MNDPRRAKDVRSLHRREFMTAFICALIAVSSSIAQVSPDEHAKHHPNQTQQPTTAPASMNGMEGMGDMMQMMGGTPPKELYPSLMDIGELSDEKRNQISMEAGERMKSGIGLLSSGLDRLHEGVSRDDFAAMQEATAQMHEGMARFESGVAARRALAENKPPRDVALQWFRTEMSLPQPAGSAPANGIGWFHAVVMTTLILFAITMIAMYFFKMRRAAALLRNLTGGAPLTPISVPTAPVSAGAGSVTVAPATGGKWIGNLRVGHIFQETSNVKTFRLMNPLGGPIPFQFLPGQFLTVTIPTNDKPVKRSYTIASSPTQHEYVELTVKHEDGGVVSGFFHTHVNPGDLLQCSGPHGSFIFTGRECKCILLIGGGVGVTPLMSVLRYLLDRSWDGEIFLLFTCRTPADIIFREELEYLERRNKNFRAIVTISRPEGTDWKGPTGRITKELITKSVPDLPTRYVHICGPVPMMEATKQILGELGVPSERIKVEAFGPAVGKVERLAIQDTAIHAPRREASAIALPTVTFSESGKSAPLPPDKVILEVAEENGVDIDFSCRVGTCGVCRVKKLSGDVTMEIEEGLQPGDKENGIILACQAKSAGDVTVQA